MAYTMYVVLQRSIRLTLVGAIGFLLFACQPDLGPTPVPEADAAVTASGAASLDAPDVVQIEPLPLDQVLAPVRIVVSDLGLDLPVVPMGWRVAQADGERITVWDVPENEVGWHVNSAGAGGAGNTILSGRQADGAKVFAPLARGNIEEGQDILLADGDGLTFVYRVTEVSDPIPIHGATEDEQARAMAYVSPEAGEARLILITGWPDFTTTHRVYVVAEFAGVIR